MAENFNTYIDNIEVGFWRELCISEGELMFFDKGAEFVKAGNVGRYIGYIKSGTMKYVVHSDDGTEHVIGLEFSGEFVTDFPFSLYRLPSRASIIAVSPCHVYCVPVTKVASLMEAGQRVKDIVMHSTEAVYSTVYDRYVDMHTKTSHRRYNELVNRHPDLFSLFSLRDIASFLNITPTHLSRLRKNS